MVLFGIPSNISPQLLHTLACMGHGDCIVLADANFPSSSISASTITPVIHESGQGTVSLIKSILKLLPLDTYDVSVYIMDVVPKDKERGLTVPIVQEYGNVIQESQNKKSFTIVKCDPFDCDINTFPNDALVIGAIEREAFYEFAKKAFAIVATGETAIYANVILRKGVISP